MAQAVLKKVRLGDLLVQAGEITAEQLSIALSEQKRSGHKLGVTLVELGFTTEQRILDTLANQLGLQLIDLRHYRY
ncbi:MAG: MSHA biogenesis protein MshE, partial [Halothiobacillaceae bacterium]